MHGYMVHFIAYSMAMVGFFGILIFVYKKLCLQGLAGNRTDFLKIENGIRINARKQILVVKAGNERFLVAADYDRTTMLAKLNSDEAESTENKNLENKEDNSINFKKDSIQINNLNNNQILNFNHESSKNVAPALKRINEKMKA